MDDDLELSTIEQEKEVLKKTESRFSHFIKEVVEEINYVRTQPLDYVKNLNNLKKYMSGKDNLIQTTNKEILIIDDIEVQFEELIKVLSKQAPLQALLENEFLVNSAEEFISTIQKHEKKDQNQITNYIIDLSNRLKKSGIINGVIGEIIDVGLIENVELIVLKILIGEKNDKSERNLILSDKIRYIGGSYFDFNFLDCLILTLNFSENNSVKKENSTINLNMKFSTDRMGRDQDSSNSYVFKKNKCDNDKKILTDRNLKKADKTNKKAPPTQNHAQQNQSNSKLFRHLSKDNQNININVTQKNQSSTNPEKDQSNIGIKNLHLSNESMLKASSLMKKMPPRINYNNTKIVNINLKIEDDGKSVSKDEILSNKNGKNSVSQSKNSLQNNLNKNLDDMLLSDDSQNENADYERKNKFNPETIDSNQSNKQSNSNMKKKNVNRSSAKDDSRKVATDSKSNLHQSSSKLKGSKSEKPCEKKMFDREIIDNKDIKCMKINKTISTDEDGKEFYIIKKTIYYYNNSLDEWIFKEEV